MHMRALGLGGLFAVVAMVGCGSSGSGGTGGSTGTGGGHAGSTGTAGNGSAGHTGSGGTTGTGGAFTTSVPSGTKITGLTGAQVTQLCADADNFIAHTYIPTLCASVAPSEGLDAAGVFLMDNPSATDAQLQTACAQAEASPGPCPFMLDPDGGLGTCDVTSTPASCQATVGDETKCLNDTVAAVSQFTAGVSSCSSLTVASVSALFADGGVPGAAEPPSCAVVHSAACQIGQDASTLASPKAGRRAAALARAFMK
jgi:hypothetical protein